MISTEQWREAITIWLSEPIELNEIHELRDWSQSQVLRITIAVGGASRIIYAKQARFEHVREASIYQLASRVEGFPAPRAYSTVIAGDDWLLIEQARGEQLSRCHKTQRYREAVKGLASFHQQALDERWLERLEGLDHVGERVSQLAHTVIAAVEARAAAGVFHELDHELAVRVQAQLNECWPAIHDELTAYPQSLIHGDCHSGNIFVQGERIQFVDWGTVALAPGLLDLVGLLDVAVRMKDEIGCPEELKELYWAQLSPEARQQYGNLTRAYQVLRIVRSLMELEWFSQTDDDYGARANRELGIIAETLASLR